MGSRKRILSFFLFGFFCIIHLASFSNQPPVFGETIQNIETYSVEGLPVQLYPPQGEIQLLIFMKTDEPYAVSLVRETIVLYERFHDRGLNVLGVVLDEEEDSVFSFAERWQIPWPQVLDAEEEEKITKTLGVIHTPFRLLIDPKGEILAVNTTGESAHQIVAEELNVALDDIPMPESPTERPQARPGVVRQPVEIGSDRGVLFKVVDTSNKHFGTNEQREAVEPCKENLREIGFAITRYQNDHNGELPQWLSDLYPKYIKDKRTFLCPENPNQSNFGGIVDPKIKTSYVYQFCPLEYKGIPDTYEAKTYREWKKQQLKEYGDKVPLVRCFHHAKTAKSSSLNLTYGGEICFYQGHWEEEVKKGHALEEPAAKARKKMRQLAAALDAYKEDHNEVPDTLYDLHPTYVKDKSLFTYQPPFTTVEGNEMPFSYQFKAGRMKTWKTEQLDEFGGYVPIIRARGVLENGNIVNLAYNGEIWESQSMWERDLGGEGYQGTPLKRRQIIAQVMPGREKPLFKMYGWNETPIETPIVIEDLKQMLPLHGSWVMDKDQITHDSASITQSILLFKPYVKDGSITFQAKVHGGSEGCRVVFGYLASDDYYVWNIGGWSNRCCVFEKWGSIQDRVVQDISEQRDYTLAHNQWHEIKLEIDETNNQVTGYINGEIIQIYKTEEPLAGRVGIGTWMTKVEFKNIRISGP
ncbi:redoxin domain-containing protein [bacterium]|nr:redoxin domain-containing protein [bacterium]